MDDHVFCFFFSFFFKFPTRVRNLWNAAWIHTGSSKRIFWFSLIQSVCKITYFARIYWDSRNIVQQNISENGFSDSRRISNPAYSGLDEDTRYIAGTLDSSHHSTTRFEILIYFPDISGLILYNTKPCIQTKCWLIGQQVIVLSEKSESREFESSPCKAIDTDFHFQVDDQIM